MRKLTVGKCPLCNKNIWKYHWVQINFMFKRLPYEMNEHGTHFWILQTDGSRMAVAICNDCAEKLTMEQVVKIFSEITFTKLEGIKKIPKKKCPYKKRYKLFDRIRTIEVYAWFKTEKALINFLKHKEENHGKKHNSEQSEHPG